MEVWKAAVVASCKLEASPGAELRNTEQGSLPAPPNAKYTPPSSVRIYHFCGTRSYSKSEDGWNRTVT
jgi:hypothetical protein